MPVSLYPPEVWCLYRRYLIIIWVHQAAVGRQIGPKIYTAPHCTALLRSAPTALLRSALLRTELEATPLHCTSPHLTAPHHRALHHRHCSKDLPNLLLALASILYLRHADLRPVFAGLPNEYNDGLTRPKWRPGRAARPPHAPR